MILDTVTDQRKEFGAKVRAARTRKGLSKVHLAARLEMHRNTIGLIEKGKIWPEYTTRTALAEFLGMPTETQAKPTPEEALDVLREALAAKPKTAGPQLTAAQQRLLAACTSAALNDNQIDALAADIEGQAAAARPHSRRALSVNEDDGKVSAELKKRRSNPR